MSVTATKRLFVNGMSIGTGGGYTVGREVTRYVALAKPDWDVTLSVIRDHPLQYEFESESLPDNVTVRWEPNRCVDPIKRDRYEQGELTRAINDEGYDGVFQLNGMILRGLHAPTLAHFQDPMAYRPEAWNGVGDRVKAWFKRRAHRVALKRAAVCGWTSNYLQELITSHHGVRPQRSEVFYNGVPEVWVERASGELPSWEDRPMEMVTVSHVWPYKRQSLVIEALARLRKREGFEGLKYRVLGGCVDDYQSELRRFAERLGVGDAVSIEGRVSDEEVEQALASARAMPLMSVCESFGIPIIEAMAYGTPVVAADACALPEVCAGAAMITPMDDVEALTETLGALLTNPELVARLRMDGAKRVADFQWKKIGDRMAESLEVMMAGRS